MFFFYSKNIETEKHRLLFDEAQIFIKHIQKEEDFEMADIEKLLLTFTGRTLIWYMITYVSRRIIANYRMLKDSITIIRNDCLHVPVIIHFLYNFMPKLLSHMNQIKMAFRKSLKPENLENLLFLKLNKEKDIDYKSLALELVLKWN